MSRNSKNARLHRQERERSANKVAARAAVAKGDAPKPEAKTPGRATAPKHNKRSAWWQRGMPYAQFIKGGAKTSRKSSSDSAGESAEGLAG